MNYCHVLSKNRWEHCSWFLWVILTNTGPPHDHMPQQSGRNVNLSSTCPPPVYNRDHPTQLADPGRGPETIVFFFFFLMGRYERGHSWQQWSVPFRWSPWQRLQTERKREGESERDHLHGSAQCGSTLSVTFANKLHKHRWMDFSM